MRRLRWFAAGLVASLIGGPALAQNFPIRPITMVVPFPPGPLDVMARWLAPKLSDALGQPVVVDHRPGANGMVGSSAVSRAAPDGYTILAATVGTHVTAVHLSKNLAYDPVNDFTPIVAAVASSRSDLAERRKVDKSAHLSRRADDAPRPGAPLPTLRCRAKVDAHASAASRTV